MAVNPPKNPEPFRQCLDSLGRLLLVRNFRCRFRFHVGRPFWLRLCLASFLARWPPSFLPSGVLSLSQVLFGNGFCFLVWNRSICFGSVSGCWFSCKTGQNAVRFCFLLFAWVRSVLGSRPQKGTENRTERTLGCSGRHSAPLFLWFFASPNGQFRTARVRSCVTVDFYGFSFSEGSVLYHKFWQTNWACCRNVSCWLVFPGFSSSLLSSSSSPVACRRNRRLLLLFQRLDDAPSPPPIPLLKVRLPKSSGCCLALLFLFRPCVVSIKRYRTG